MAASPLADTEAGTEPMDASGVARPPHTVVGPSVGTAGVLGVRDPQLRTSGWPEPSHRSTTAR